MTTRKLRPTPQDIEFLRRALDAAIRDITAHRLAHKGEFAATLSCHMDTDGVCHGSGEDFTRFARAALQAYQKAVRAYYE